MVADVFHFYAGAVDKHHGETIPVAGGVDLTFREPLGVVGLIVPWNFPLNIASWKLGPALACGNTVVLKPAELTPLSALRLGELILEAGIPEGVVNVIVGKGSVVGRRLVEHPDVAKIGFTGSTEVGREVMRGAAGTIKRVTLELGGKSANVVFADADLERAAAAAPYAVFDNAGQDCCARSRILVERSAYDRFLELLVDATSARARRRPGGRGDRDGAADLGGAPRDGRRLRRGGEPLFRGEIPAGPRLLVSVHDRRGDERRPDRARGGVRAGRGGDPVRRRGGRDPARERHAVRPLRLDLDARRRAARCACARASRPGVLSVNSNTSVRVSTPFGGFKQSGFGRELGMQALDGLLGGQERVHLDGGLGGCVARLDGKVCVITGAGGGMGREAAIAFSEEGAIVCAADVSLEAVEETVVALPARPRVRRRRADVSERGGRPRDARGDGRALRRDRRALQQRGHLARRRRVRARHVGRGVGARPGRERTGVFLCCKHGIPYLLERGGGSVINVASFVAILGAATSQIAYTASKGAVLSMSRELGVQFARRGRARQRALPGAGRDAAAPEHLRQRPGRARAAADPLADRPAREAARDRQRRALPGERRVVVRQRRDLRRRRRPDRRLRDAGVASDPCSGDCRHLRG